MKFGYPSKKKVGKFKKSCYSFVTCWNLLFKYGNFRNYFFPGNLEILSHIFYKNPMHVSHWIILGSTK
jgi:hypothetical protein